MIDLLARLEGAEAYHLVAVRRGDVIASTHQSDINIVFLVPLVLSAVRVMTLLQRQRIPWLISGLLLIVPVDSFACPPAAAGGGLPLSARRQITELAS